ncbi:MAG: PAS domain-containing protein [Candidatus Hodarchaeales archaeon]|jgi:PAS domain S-box-containing protein
MAELPKEDEKRKKSEKEDLLRIEQAELAIEGSGLGLWDWDLNSGEVHFSHQWADIIGYDPKEIKPYISSWEKIIHKDDLPNVRKKLDAHLVGQKPYSEDEYRVRTKSGEWKWILTKGKIVERDEDGKPTRLAGIHVDITQRKRVEEALKVSEEKYRTVVNSSLQGIIISQVLPMKVIFANEKITEILGFTTDEIMAFNPEEIIEFIHPEDRKLVLQRSQDHLAGKTTIDRNEIRVFKKNGTLAWMEFYSSSMEFSGKPTVISAFVDITERKLAEEELRKRERFLFSIITSIQDGISILDTEFNIIQVNPTMERWYSHALPLTRKKCYEAYHRRQIPCETCPTSKTLETKKAAKEIVPKRGPGGKITGWLDLYTFPLLDTETNRLRGVIEYVRDISDQKTAEQKREELEQVVKHSPIVVFLWRNAENWPVEYVSDNIRQFGYEPEDFYSERVFYADIIHPDDLKLVTSEIDYNIDTESEFELQYRIITKSGVTRWITSSTWVRKDSENLITHYQGIVIDNSERRILKENEDFLRLLKRANPPKRQKILIDKAREVVKVSTSLIDKVRDLRKVGQTAIMNKFDIDLVFNSVIDDYAEIAKENEIEISYQAVKKSVRAGSLLIELFANLIENAILHSRCKKIEVSVEERDQNVIITVEDDGKGLPREIANKIFERGVKGNSSKGSGLGLFLVKSIVDSYGGRIEIKKSKLNGLRIDVSLLKA